MHRFAVIAAGLLSIAGSTTAASAADLAARTYSKAPAVVAPIYDWSGFYIGVNGGGASSHGCWTLTSNAGIPLSPTPSEGCHDATGSLAGGQIGYRWQRANWVFGVEAQGDWADLTGSNESLALRRTLVVINRTRIDAVGLFTGQLGYAWNNVLLYVKGGAAVTDNKYSGIFTITGIEADQTRETRWGGVAGAGVEIGFAPNWSVAVEYDHLFMGSSSNTFPLTSFIVSRSDSIAQDVDMATVRLNYRFGGPVGAKY